MRTRICPICGKEFEPKSAAQKYCNRTITVKCINCGKEFQTICNKEMKKCCSTKCRAQYNEKQGHTKYKICVKCGRKFLPKSSRQRYCHKPVLSYCVICGKEFYNECDADENQKHICDNSECRNKYAHLKSVESVQQQTKKCKWCGKSFHPATPNQIHCTRTHYQICKNCGKKFVVHPELAVSDTPIFCSQRCSQLYHSGENCVFSNKEVRERIKQTMLQKYGVEYPMQSPEVVADWQEKYKERTGYIHPIYNPEVRSKAAKHVQTTNKFEQRVAALLDNYDIEYVHHYMLQNNVASHEFDFFLPKYKILIDCDGVYFHSYLSDPNGKQVLDYYDEDRLALIPKDYIFHVIVEGQEEHDIKELESILQSIDNHIFDYDSYLFRWCRSISFPYPKYDKKRMYKDYEALCKYNAAKYTPSSQLGMSIIDNFHLSLYDAHVGNYSSPKDAWNNDSLLKKVIANRLIYKNNVDPHKILKGFNISKICPCVSKFNPVLARYLILKYLDNYNYVFDPFSGFSGRLLGTLSCNKHYIGQDLNENAVGESNQIIKFLDAAENAEITVKDILQSHGKYECLLTCPPYYTKEIYNKEDVFKTCDEWITECLQRFDCNRYVFVVDQTTKYVEYVTEEIKHTSHLTKTKEQVIVIDNEN